MENLNEVYRGLHGGESPQHSRQTLVWFLELRSSTALTRQRTMSERIASSKFLLQPELFMRIVEPLKPEDLYKLSYWTSPTIIRIQDI